MGETDERRQPVKAQLGLWDAVSIIVGIVIGSTIFRTPPVIFSNVSGPWMALGVWLLGGVLSLIGAFCYAELTTTYPRSGGDYVYLTRAFGRPVGFLFGWAQLAVILTGSIGAMAFIFAEYAVEYAGIEAERREPLLVGLAVAAVVGLSLLNILGVSLGKVVQNVLSLVKVLGLAGVVVAGVVWGPAEYRTAAAWSVEFPPQVGFGVAMILVLYAYGGWNDAAFVAAEVRDKKNLPRALILGTALVTLIYLAVNAAYLLGLGFEEARKFRPIAADVLALPLHRLGFQAMCLLVMVAALGAINGLIFTGSRLYSSLGAEHRVFAVLGRWHPLLGSPLWSLLVQMVLSVAMILLVGAQAGRDLIDAALLRLGLEPMPWERYFGGFETLFAGTAPVFWGFFLLTGIALFVLRVKDRGIERPFALPVPFFPLLPLIFCGMCLYGLWSAATYARWVTLIGVVPLLAGVPLYFVSYLERRRGDWPSPGSAH
ncbi:MAG: amino acid permease [Gemmataceae bacterium]|nr:amino acid permease [Gemmataceae bacterium]MDW8264713.1 amino acid permease [Gemmataceae bacterium]